MKGVRRTIRRGKGLQNLSPWCLWKPRIPLHKCLYTEYGSILDIPPPRSLVGERDNRASFITRWRFKPRPPEGSNPCHQLETTVLKSLLSTGNPNTIILTSHFNPNALRVPNIFRISDRIQHLPRKSSHSRPVMRRSSAG